MLNSSILNKLNEQIKLEHFASNLYLSMSSWCKAQGLDGAADFLLKHSLEELDHMRKLFNYVNDSGAQAKISAIEEPESEFANIKELFESTMKHEVFITGKINELVDLALKEKDYSTFNFLQWYVSEQHEEEALFQQIVDKISVIGLDGRGLYLVDKEIGKLAAV
ncbi:non-heme ferritin [Marinifilum caeruleilacunae]|uniref:Ferritin n=1 Tax=Marinifilum caeruleilacunae TaxID=2499076 RepID=A0ABX1WUF8_9BACT|nr:non-heme ferritin [Marinifilum caeruleilacunae]NOU59715.1 non-heme ferritin [Marinifilum caeruleilacunae]